MHTQTENVKRVTFYTLTSSFLQLWMFWIYPYDIERKKKEKKKGRKSGRREKQTKPNQPNEKCWTTNKHMKNRNLYNPRFWIHPVGMRPWTWDGLSYSVAPFALLPCLYLCFVQATLKLSLHQLYIYWQH